MKHTLFLAAALLISCSLYAQSDLYCTSPAPTPPSWQCTGPYDNYYSPTLLECAGRVDFVWVDTATGGAHILASGNTGGLWQSTDTGHTWHCLTDGITTGYTGVAIPGCVPVAYMAVDPVNHNNIFLYLYMPATTNKSWGYPIGLIYTTDGGSAWALDTAYNNAAASLSNTGGAWEMKYMPGTEKLFVLDDGQALVKNGTGGGPWTALTPPWHSPDDTITDMEFTLASPGKVIFSTNADDDTAHLWTYDTSGSGSWADLKVTMPSGGGLLSNIDNMSVSAADSVFMLVEVRGAGQQIIKTALSTLSVSILNSGTYGFQFLVVSPNNTQVMYASLHNGTNNFYQSTDWGANFITSIQGGTFYNFYTHADGRYINIYWPAASGDTYGDVLYGGTDGGVVMKRAGNANFESITGDSLCITQFYSITNTDADEDIMEGGAQDNGGFSYVKNRAVPWHKEDNLGGDNYLAKFARNGVTTALTESDFPGLEYAIFSDTIVSAGIINNPNDEANGYYWSEANNVWRPYQFDANNNAYVGYFYIWKQALSSALSGGAWSPAFNSYPVPDSTNKVCNFIFAGAGTDTVYIAYKDGGTSDSSMSSLINEKLFVTYNAHPLSGSPTWYNITPGEIQWERIDDITIDPQHPGRIWVVFGDLSGSLAPDSMEYRVQYSPDYGTTWIDVSTGLPPFPVNKILYRKGSNDILYCATDIGVYRCDFSTYDPSATFSSGGWVNRSVTWQCYNTGMPACDVEDMEINYCANKLRVATFGRGIWETPLDSITVLPDTLTTVITTPTTWSTNQYLQNSITVMPGGTLTLLGDTVYMPKNGIINIEAGGHLIVDNAVITNGCAQCFWQGIQLNGSDYLQQTAANDGWATIENNSVIANALVGVTNYNSSGGIVQAVNSSFIDNNNDVTLSGYTWFNLDGVPGVNLCYFYNCNFLLDNNYKGDAMNFPAAYFVSLESVSGVSFQGCRWLNRDTFALDSLRGYGLFANSAGFSVSSWCPDELYYLDCPDLVPSRFCGFTNGINVQNTFGADFTISVATATFDSSGIGVNVSAQNNVACTADTFNVGNGIGVIAINGFCPQNIGLYLQNTTIFKDEGNVFTGNPSGAAATVPNWQNIGAIVANSDPALVFIMDPQPLPVNTIYRNIFTGLTEGAYALGMNNGLSILCNNFSYNTTDIYVVSEALFI